MYIKASLNLLSQYQNVFRKLLNGSENQHKKFCCSQKGRGRGKYQITTRHIATSWLFLITPLDSPCCLNECTRMIHIYSSLFFILETESVYGEVFTIFLQHWTVEHNHLGGNIYDILGHWRWWIWPLNCIKYSILYSFI